MSPTDIVKDDWVCMFAAECQQPPVPRTTAASSHGHLSVRGYDDEDDDEDEDDSDDIYIYIYRMRVTGLSH